MSLSSTRLRGHIFSDAIILLELFVALENLCLLQGLLVKGVDDSMIGTDENGRTLTRKARLCSTSAERSTFSLSEESL